MASQRRRAHGAATAMETEMSRIDERTEDPMSIHGWEGRATVADWRPVGWTAADEARAEARRRESDRLYWGHIARFLALPAEDQQAYMDHIEAQRSGAMTPPLIPLKRREVA